MTKKYPLTEDKNQFKEHTKQDLIQKAVGWMLREMGKQNKEEITRFLNKYATQMPRTTLRYLIEKLPKKQRNQYLNLR